MKQQGQFLLFAREEFAEWLSKQNIKRKIKTIQNHHTWSPSYKHFNGNNHFERLEAIDNYHEDVRGWSDSGQNIVTFPDGTIAICRPLEITPAGIKGNNTNSICVEHFGNFDIGGDVMTEEHRKSIIFINAVLCEKFKLPINTNSIVYHRWFDLDTGKRILNHKTIGSFKTCPGTNFFNGNLIADAEKHFIPLVEQEIENKKRQEVVNLMAKYFKDVPASHWGAKSADSLYEKKIVVGDGMGNLKPNDKITRIEAVALIDRAIDYVMKELGDK